MNEHADTIRRAVDDMRGALGVCKFCGGRANEMHFPDCPAPRIIGALDVLEAELAEAQGQITSMTLLRAAAEAENARLKEALTQIELWPYDVDSDAHIDLRQIKDFARRASGSEGDTA